MKFYTIEHRTPAGDHAWVTSLHVQAPSAQAARLRASRVTGIPCARLRVTRTQADRAFDKLGTQSRPSPSSLLRDQAPSACAGAGRREPRISKGGVA